MHGQLISLNFILHVVKKGKVSEILIIFRHRTNARLGKRRGPYNAVELFPFHLICEDKYGIAM